MPPSHLPLGPSRSSQRTRGRAPGTDPGTVGPWPHAPGPLPGVPSDPCGHGPPGTSSSRPNSRSSHITVWSHTSHHGPIPNGTPVSVGSHSFLPPPPNITHTTYQSLQLAQSSLLVPGPDSVGPGRILDLPVTPHGPAPRGTAVQCCPRSWTSSPLPAMPIVGTTSPQSRWWSYCRSTQQVQVRSTWMPHRLGECADLRRGRCRVR